MPKLFFVQKPTGHAFISYVREDSRDVDQLQRTLEAAGVSVWRDTADLWPGEDWRVKIRRAITDNALVFIACFSSRSMARKKSYQNEELFLAIEQLRLRHPDDPWLIPVRLDDCDIPDLGIGGNRTLASIQRADLFGNNRDLGIARLVAAVLRILGRHSDLSIRKQSANARSNTGIADESNPEEVLPFPQASQRFDERPGKSAAEPVDTTATGSKMTNPLKLSGRNSKVLEVDLARGRYLVSWDRGGKGYFAVRDESARSGEGDYLLQHLSSYPDSGEKVVRIAESGLHLLSVDGNNLNWTITFKPI